MKNPNEDENSKIDEAIDYIKWLIKDLSPDAMYSYKDVMGTLLSVIGHMTILKAK